MPVPLVIIGAPRSGTNMLRDALCRLDDFVTWDCDEINYIWRFGNRDYPNDQLTPAHASPTVRGFIRRQFERLAHQHRHNHRQPRWLVEKTCANSLRVPFVDAVLPDARYLFLIRDGRDATASSMIRWSAKPDWRYLLQKARHVPKRDLPHYGTRYLRNYWHRLQSTEQRYATWGPVTSALGQLVREAPLHQVCAHQWEQCVTQSDQAFAQIDPGRVHTIAYEQLVSKPAETFQQLFTFLDHPLASTDLQRLASGLSTRSIGKWRTQLAPAIAQDIESTLAETLNRFGYEASPDDMHVAPKHGVSELGVPMRSAA